MLLCKAFNGILSLLCTSPVNYAFQVVRLAHTWHWNHLLPLRSTSALCVSVFYFHYVSQKKTLKRTNGMVWHLCGQSNYRKVYGTDSRWVKIKAKVRKGRLACGWQGSFFVCEREQKFRREAETFSGWQQGINGYGLALPSFFASAEIFFPFLCIALIKVMAMLSIKCLSLKIDVLKNVQ